MGDYLGSATPPYGSHLIMQLHISKGAVTCALFYYSAKISPDGSVTITISISAGLVV